MKIVEVCVICSTAINNALVSLYEEGAGPSIVGGGQNTQGPEVWGARDRILIHGHVIQTVGRSLKQGIPPRY